MFRLALESVFRGTSNTYFLSESFNLRRYEAIILKLDDFDEIPTICILGYYDLKMGEFHYGYIISISGPPGKGHFVF